MTLHSVRIIESVHACVRTQVRFPRTKKRRIQKKWAKQERNVEYRPTAFIASGVLVAHPSIVAQLREKAARDQEAWERKWS